MNDFYPDDLGPLFGGRSAAAGPSRPPVDTEDRGEFAPMDRGTTMVALGVPALYAVMFGIACLASSPHLRPGDCHGIGFGCSLPPRESVQLVGLAAGVTLLPLYWGLSAILVRLADACDRAAYATLMLIGELLLTGWLVAYALSASR